MEYIEISNGIKLPAIGFGPGICGYSAKCVRRRSGLLSIPGRVYNRLVKRPFIEKEYVGGIAGAIRGGYRLIDYSAAYGDGSLIAKGIKASGISRDELILTTRVSNRAQFAGAESVRNEFFGQLKNMKTDYVDIFMFHWPVTGCYENTWKVMVELYEQGYVKILGVANCHEHHLEVLFNLTEVKPLINQFEVHPLFTQKKLIRYCLENGIRPEAYTPTARFDDRLVRLPLLHRMGKKYGKSVLQIILRWHVQNGVIPVVRALNKSHQQENIGIFDFFLSEDEMADIDGININARVRYDPDNCDFSIL